MAPSPPTPTTNANVNANANADANAIAIAISIVIATAIVTARAGKLNPETLSCAGLGLDTSPDPARYANAMWEK